MSELERDLDSLAQETRFSGAVRVESRGSTLVEKAYGLANRAYGVPNRVETRFGIASGTKGLTALTVAALLEDGLLALSTPVRSLLGEDLPLVDGDVTVEHLLAHRSGIGDYLDEEGDWNPADYLMPVPVHELAATEQYLRVLDGHPQKFPPGERFAYSNSGYVVLALVAERASSAAFHELVLERVCRPAGMSATAFLRSDELPADAAVGYLGADGPRTNVFHLPVRGSGDGGIYSTVGDFSVFWQALFEGRIVAQEWVDELLRPRSEVTKRSGARVRYALGFWLHESTDTVALEGYDAGVSFRSVHDPHRQLTHTVVSNTSEGAFPLGRFLDEQLETSPAQPAAGSR
jgi:CubicO group peptidase (beta-lactamase class C family)